MKYYLRYYVKHLDNKNIQLTYHNEKSLSISNALEFASAIKVLDIHKIKYTAAVFHYFSGKTYYLYIEKNNFKKISRILINDKVRDL